MTTEVEADVQAMFAEYWDRFMGDRDGRARQWLWQCKDGWIVGYTTTKIKGGPDDGKWAALGYKPRGKGARTGDPSSWERVYYVTSATRKLAKARALRLTDKHDEIGRKRRQRAKRK